MIELHHAEEVAAACGGDDLLVWTAQRLPEGGARAFAHGGAVVAACPAVSKHDRLAVFGAAGDPALPALVRRVWREMGTGLRPFGDREVIHRLVEAMPGELGPAGNFTWMTVDPHTVRLDPARLDTARLTTGPLETRSLEMKSQRGRDDLPGLADVSGPLPAGLGRSSSPAAEPSPSAPGLAGRAGEAGEGRRGPVGSGGSPVLVEPRVGWLGPGDVEEVARVLAVANPDAYARPGMPGVFRWAGIRDEGGRLVAVGADAWSAPTVGFVGGVATLPQARGSGLAGAICRFLTAALLERHGRVSLMVDDVNAAALAVYRRLGYARRPVAATRAVQEA
uniref:GNAT family N-acetyltransferase n=1 Tax=Herbidospora sakaeratensis TaxID=564415 RepID=UPI0007821D28|nr:GNAT family N-acetyltransferase [Herbidospora sakaeratensis]